MFILTLRDQLGWAQKCRKIYTLTQPGANLEKSSKFLIWWFVPADSWKIPNPKIKFP